jgi:FtsP/CotA-like multicopper oxidase with cupredoxin domain
MIPTMKMSTVLKSMLAATGLLLWSTAQAGIPGITGAPATPSFAISASADYNSQPDGNLIYSWGYGCTTAPTGFSPPPAAGSQGPAAYCPLMQMPGPTMIVTEGDVVTVTLTNSLPAAAGNTSIVFSGFDVSASGGVDGRLVKEAANGGGTVTYTFTAAKPGTYSYYSGTQPELQIEMGLTGAVVVMPKAASDLASGCKAKGEFSLAASAYGHSATCYDREYLFQFSEMNSLIHEQVKAQVEACPAAPCPQVVATLEPQRPNYYLINGRSMPDIMDTSYSTSYAHQPYNGNPHMHPGELVLMRVIGQGRWQHPFHFHGNHARVLARDGNLLLSQSDDSKLAGPLLFTIPTVSGQSVDAIFTWTGKGLNWDVYNHVASDGIGCMPDANGYHSVKTDPNYGEWCADHGKPIPVTPPDPQIVLAGQWYGGTPYLGLQSAAQGFTATPEAPGTLNQNPQAGYAYMWHSHNEREITTNDVLPGGMMMMLLIDPPVWYIDETL